MNGEVLKIALAVLRIFIDSHNKGNECTLGLEALNNQVCRNMSRSSKKDRQKTRAHMVSALQALTDKRILFMGTEKWSDDPLARPKEKQTKYVYGLTHAALDHITRTSKNVEGHSAQSKIALMDLLAAFNAIKPQNEEQMRIQPPPAVLVETISAIVEKESDVTTRSTNITVSANNNNVQRLVSEIRGMRWHNASSPANLLGALRQQTALSAASGVNAPDVQFEPHKLKDAAARLVACGCAAYARTSTVSSDTRNTSLKQSGLYLTDLGLSVAEAGDFQDNRETHQRYVKKKIKATSMVKNSKKTFAVAPQSTNTMMEIRLSNGTIVPCRSAEEAAAFCLAVGGHSTQSAGVPAVETPEEPTTLSLDDTIAQIVSPTVQALCQAIATADSTEGAPDGLDTVFLCHAITTVHNIVSALKHVVRERLADGQRFSANDIADYGAQVALDMEQLAAGKSRKLTLLSLERERSDLPTTRWQSDKLEPVIWRHVSNLVGK
jgi:hypothetical protein